MLPHIGVRTHALLAAFLFAAHAPAAQLEVPAEYPTIQAAINAAVTGDVVMVAPGTYAEKLDLLGKEITLRGSGALTTIIDGAGLAGTLLLARTGETAATVVEGFTFTNGEGQPHPNCAVSNAVVAGAMYVRASGLTIRDCRFHRNGYSTRVAAGAAMMLVAGATVNAERCVFSENGPGAGIQTAFGGAIMRCEGVTDLRLTDCTFTGNTASHGGGVRSSGGSLTVTGCTFTGNTSAHGGGINAEGAGSAQITVTDSTFTGNTASHGGGLRANVVEVSQLRVTGCAFRDNTSSFGGGINAFTTLNSSDDDTGVFIDDCEFLDNDTGFGGGLFGYVSVANSSPVVVPPRIHVTNSRFIGNSASAACCNTGIVWTWCFQDGINWGTYYGGGADIREQNGGEIKVVNCLFANNASTNAGGLHVATCAETSYGFPGGTVEITNVTAVGNAPDGLHLRVGEQGNIQVRNAIVRGNTANQISTLVSNPVDGQVTIDVDYSNVQGGYAGAGNIDADPLFADPVSGDFRLSVGSASIDAGNNSAVPSGVLVDLGGGPRFVDDPATPDTGVGSPPIVDMGAFEFSNVCGTSDFDGDGDSGTDADIESFFACLAGNCCPTCFPGGADFNADGDSGTDADIESFFRVLAGGPC